MARGLELVVKVGGLLLGAGVAGVALLVYRHLQQQKAATGTSDPCIAARDLANAAQPGSGAAAYAACKALGAVITDWDARDRRNRELNGDVELPLALAAAAHTVSPTRGNAPALRGTVARFKNGCAPFEGAPGWEKCAPGTESMALSGQLQTRKLGAPNELEPTEWGHAFTADDGDPFTQGPYKSDGKLSVKIQTPSGVAQVTVPDKFDLPLAAGETGWVSNGRAFKCAPGTSPAWSMRDHRDPAAVPPCTVGGESPWTSSGAPATASSSVTSTKLTCDGEQAPAGYTYRRTADGAWFLDRLRAGEQPEAGPCRTGAIDPGNLAVVNGGFARMQ